MSYLIQHKNLEKPGKESIHSGHFMVSQFEAEEQDDEENVAVPIPEVIDTKAIVRVNRYVQGTLDSINNRKSPQQVAIDHSLSKLFQCMSLAYSNLPQQVLNFNQIEKQENTKIENAASNGITILQDTGWVSPEQIHIYDTNKEEYNTFEKANHNEIIVLQNAEEVLPEQASHNEIIVLQNAEEQKLTSPKWNRFRGIRLRWKDKIRLNNVIWRCWHLQFIKKENTLICQFASPLDVDTHNKPEAIVLEGKYWKRKLAAVTAEYKRWRMFYRNNLHGLHPKEDMDMLSDVDALLGESNSMDNMNMMIDEDYMGLMSDTLFSTITNQPFAFPDTREIARAGLADFIQPSLGPLQPNLDDYGMDTFDPLQDLLNNKLPTVPEEQTQVNWDYRDYPENVNTRQLTPQITHMPNTSPIISQYQSQIQEVSQQTIAGKQMQIQDSPVLSTSSYNNIIIQPAETYIQTHSYPSLTKMVSKPSHSLSRGKPNHNMQSSSYPKQTENTSVYTGYNSPNVEDHVIINDRIQVSLPKNGQPLAPHRTQVTEVPQNDQYRPAVSQSTSQGYKFAAPSRPNIKFTSQNMQVQTQAQMLRSSMHASHTLSYRSTLASLPNDDKIENRGRGAPRGRVRSRSNTREPIKRPPLISAVSDPALLTSQTNVLLTQLLTTNSPLSEAVQAYNHNQNIGSTQELSQRIRVKEETNTVPILPQPPPNTLITLPSQITVATVPLSNGDNTYLPYSNSSSPLDSPSQNLHSPTSSQGSVGSPGRDSSCRDRRVGHIHAEQKRRCNIKNGFDMIHSLIPQLNQNPNAKLSKAAMLQKGAEYIRQLRSERNQLRDEMDSLRQQIETLNTSISNCQSMLPATGAPVSRRRDSRMQEMFDEYVSTRTMENWKFWIFSLICRPLLNSFNNFVSTSSLDDLYTSTVHWIEQHCTLVDLRPVVLNSLRYLCTKTEILSEPEKLPEETRQLVLNKDKK